MLKTILLILMLSGAAMELHAQFISTQANGLNHNHYSIESVENDVIMAGTVFPADVLADPSIHVQRMGANGNVLWEVFYDIGNDERCLDMKLQGKKYILLTGVNFVDGKHRIFVMRLNQSNGSLVDMVNVYDHGATPYIEQFGLEILYSKVAGKYYLVGWGSESPISIGSSSTNEIGLLISLNNNLSFDWSREIGASTTQTLYRSEMRSITEIPGLGIVVNGNSNASFTAAVSGAFCFDYNGNLIWNTSHTATRPPILNGPVNLWQTKGALYDSQNDKYYYTEIHEVIGSYLVEVSDASTSGAYISRIADYTDLERQHNIVANIEFIDIDYETNTLMLAGYSFDRPGHYLTQKHKNTFIQVDLSSLAAVYVNVHDAGNPGLKYHDQLFNSPLGIFPKTLSRFTNWQDGYGMTNYEYSDVSGVNVYNLTVTQTDGSGQNYECEKQYEIETFYPDFSLSGSLQLTSRLYDCLAYSPEDYQIPHTQNFGCPEPLPCDINISGISRTNTYCYQYAHTLNVTPGSGTLIYEYVWDWGDGNTTTTNTPSATHSYGFHPNSCGFTVCVTAKGVGANGQLCQDTFCQYMLMVNTQVPNCGSCGPTPPPTANSKHALSEELTFGPNPAHDYISFTGFNDEMSVDIFDLSGKIIVSKKAMSQGTFDVGSLSSGTYFIFAKDESGNSLKSRLVILK